MLNLQMRTAIVPAPSASKFDAFVSDVNGAFRPLIAPTLGSQSAVLGFPLGVLRPRQQHNRVDEFTYRRPIEKAEVFTDGTSLFVITLTREKRHQRVQFATSTGLVEEVEEKPPQLEVDLYYIGPDLHSPRLAAFESAANKAFSVELKAHQYTSDRFDELLAEGRTPPEAPATFELTSSLMLQDHDLRGLALAIKASGGLLVRDLPKQLRAEARDRSQELQGRLTSSALVTSEIVVLCSKTQAQTLRLPSMQTLSELSSRGLKCACGKPIAEERAEEALTISDEGRALLERSRWLTILVLNELATAGIPISRMLIEQQAGGDEIDLLADISGELVMFELKDKEFNLGNAYSFGAKIGIIRPQHPVIVSTEYVGGDAKDHFLRARLARPRTARTFLTEDEDDRTPIRYIEGLDTLSAGIRNLAADIYSSDAIRILGPVLQLASIDPRSIVEAMAGRQTIPIA